MTGPLNGEAPPSNVELEQLVLGAILMDPKVFCTVSFLKPEHFHEEVHQKIYEAASTLHSAGKIVTLPMVRPYLPNGDTQIGSITLNQYLAKLAAEGAPTTKWAPDYARQLIEWHRRRVGYFWGEELRRIASEGGDTESALAEAQAELKAISDRPPVKWLEMSQWDSEPIPERQWAIFNRVPLNQAGLFSGEGGTGKSIIELHKNVAHVAGKDWLGSLPEPGPAFYIGAEDDANEIHIRLAAIAKHCGVTFAQLKQLWVLPLLGQDATLCASGKSGRVETTGLYKQIYEAAGDIKPRNISIDTLSRAFAGSEIDRVQVYAFAQHMQALAMVAQGSVTILSHPSLSGINSGSGISGSTAWHGAFRFRQYLTSSKPDAGEQPDNDLRQLEFKKNQYGPIGETIVLRYQSGLFLPVAGMSGLEKVAADQKADDVFLELLRRFDLEKRNVSDKHSPTFAPTVFAKEKEAKEAKIGSRQLEDAMRRLFKAGKIENEVTGSASRQRSRLVAK
jgi:RecA-family ATPase